MKFVALLLFIAQCICAGAQNDSIQPPYKRFPSVPPFKLQLPDSSTIFTKADLTKKTPLLLMVFSPDCDHCKHETEELVKHIDKFKKIQIVMATAHPFSEMKNFYETHKLGNFKNITVGRDVSYLLPPFFNMSSMPFLAFYDKKGQLISVFQGSLPMEKVAERFGIEW